MTRPMIESIWLDANVVNLRAVNLTKLVADLTIHHHTEGLTGAHPLQDTEDLTEARRQEQEDMTEVHPQGQEGRTEALHLGGTIEAHPPEDTTEVLHLNIVIHKGTTQGQVATAMI